MNDNMERAAFHEAGHAVANLMRGHPVHYIDVNNDGSGLTWHQTWGIGGDSAFCAFGGIYAEARYNFERDDDEDEEYDLDIHISGVRLAQPADSQVISAYNAEEKALVGARYREASAHREVIWCRELDREWSRIGGLAAALVKSPHLDRPKIERITRLAPRHV